MTSGGVIYIVWYGVSELSDINPIIGPLQAVNFGNEKRY
jgi:hypothetical protein